MATTVPTAEAPPPGGRAIPLRRPPLAAAVAAGAVALELAVAGALTVPGYGRVLLLLAAVAGLAVVFAFPLGSAVGLVLLTASVYTGSLFQPSIGPLQVHPPEILLAALMLVAIVAPRSRTWGGVTGLALAVFLGAVALSGVLAVQAQRVSLSDAFNTARPLALFTSFWVVLRLFPDARSLRRLLLAGLAGGALAGLAAVPLALGAPLPAALQSSAQDVISQVGSSAPGGLLRVRFPGVAPAYILFWWAVVAAMAARGARRTILAALTGAAGLGIVLSFNRNMWVGLAFGLALMMVLAGPRVRGRLVVGVLLAGVAALGTLSLPSKVESSDQLGLILKRATTLLSPQHIGQESSLQHRAEETATAWRAFQTHPVLGVGPGADFGVRFNFNAGNGVYLTGVQRFLHDQWLWMLLIGGLPALAACAVFLGSALLRAWRPRDRSLSQTALGVGLAMTALSSFVMISLSVYEFCLMLGVVCAAILRTDALRRGRPAP